MLIGGEWCDAVSGARIEVRDPATGDVITTVPAAGNDDVDGAVPPRARRSSPGVGRGPAGGSRADGFSAGRSRGGQRERVGRDRDARQRQAGGASRSASTSRRRSISCATAPAGRPRSKGTTLDVSMPGVPQERVLRLHAARAGRRGGRDHPVELPAADGGVEDRPGAGHRLHHRAEARRGHAAHRAAPGELALEAGFPPGVVNVVTGDGRTAGAALARIPASTRWRSPARRRSASAIGKAAIDNMTRVSLELGGKSPVIVLDDVDPEGRRRAARPTRSSSTRVRSAWRARGSTCSARLFDAVLERRQRDRRARCGSAPASSRRRSSGRSCPEKQLRRVSGYMRKGLDEGATLVAGGERHGRARLVSPADRSSLAAGVGARRAGRDLRAGARGHAVRRRRRGGRGWPTTRPTDSRRASGRTT